LEGLNLVKINKEIALKHAVDMFEEGYNCAEASLLGLAVGMERRDEVLPASFTCFGGGMGRSDLICGAVSGSLAGLGLAVDRKDPKDKEGKERAYKLAKDFIKDFMEMKDSVYCTDLCGCNISTEDGIKAFNENIAHMETCKGVVKFSVELAAGMIEKA
jgi:C_GCAxxG_C_C family probable redox protein